MSVGYIDFYGYHPTAGGWLLCGWVALPNLHSAHYPDCRGTARVVFETGELSGDVVLACFERDDLGNRGVGVVLFFASSGRLLGRLVSVELQAGPTPHQLLAVEEARHLRDTDVTNRLRPILTEARRDDGRAELLVLLARRLYDGESTLESLTDFVAIEIDEVILCQPDGLVLLGWYLTAADTVRSLHVRCGINTAELRQCDFISIERADVIAAVGQQHGFADARCGFIAFVQDITVSDEPVFIQIETRRREIGFKTVPSPRLRGIHAIRRILESFVVQYGDVAPALQNVVYPAVSRLQRERMLNRPAVTELVFGGQLETPRQSIIVPLYGRMELMEYQIGVLAAKRCITNTELIYVLDDPPKRRDLETLSESIYLRFGIPFRLVMLSHNMGFAPANNIGLTYARGEFVCFLNSDVFPGTPDWLERLVTRLEEDRSLGVVGPLLLFEDGSVQHEGMAFKPICLFGDILFPLHTRKGRRPRAIGGVVQNKFITGACMVLRRSLAQDLGGFDEAYAIGDFEDTDLCHKIGGRGIMCAVDHDVHLYHLERKSQDSPGQRWRMNLTLYNAWVHQCRWFGDRSTKVGPR